MVMVVMVGVMVMMMACELKVRPESGVGERCLEI